YRALFWRRPWTAAALSAMLLSLAGIPLTAGFVGKFYIVAAGVNTSLWLLVVMLAVNSAIGLYYYIKIIAVMFEREESEVTVSDRLRPSVYTISGVTVAVLVGLLFWVGVYPEWVVTVIRTYIAGG